MKIPVVNNLTNFSEKSYLSFDESSGAGTIRVKNINAFTKQYAVQIGETGQEQSEVALLANTTVAGTGLSIDGTIRFSHPVDTPVYNIKYDKVIFKVSTSGTAGTATAITDGTVSITPDSNVTVFDHTAGAASYAYKTSFFNSATSAESEDSDWITPEGYPFYSLSRIRERIKSKLKNYRYIKDDSTIDEWINEWLETMNNAAIKVNKAYGMGTAEIDLGATGLGTVTAEDFKTVKKFEINFSGTYKRAEEKDLSVWEDDDTFSDTLPKYSWKGDSVFQALPQQAGTARLTYYKLTPILEDDGDLLPLPMRGYTRSFVNYGLSQAKIKDDKASLEFESKAERDKGLFMNEISPRDFTESKTIEMLISPTAN